MQQVVRITGKAKDVFGAIQSLADKAGQLTIGEIIEIKEDEQHENISDNRH